MLKHLVWRHFPMTFIPQLFDFSQKKNHLEDKEPPTIPQVLSQLFDFSQKKNHLEDKDKTIPQVLSQLFDFSQKKNHLEDK